MKYSTQLLLVFIAICLSMSCTKEDTDVNYQRAPIATTTSSTNGATNSLNQLIFESDTITHFTVEQTVVANHLTINAVNTVNDIQIGITLGDKAVPFYSTINYQVTTDSLASRKCNVTIAINKALYTATSGSVAINNSDGSLQIRMYALKCLSPSDSQPRKASGILYFN